MWRVMINVYFKSQDGYDYMSHEYSGERYDTWEEAKAELDEARDEDNALDLYIEEV